MQMMSSDPPRIGDRVSVTLTGELVSYDSDLGVWQLLGTAPGVEHVEWKWQLHWATEFVPVETTGGPMRRKSPMPEEYEPLAVYNGERSRGIVHSAEYDAEMAALQEQFNHWSRERYRGDGVVRIIDGERLPTTP